MGGEIDDRGVLASVEPDEIAALPLGGGIIAAGEIALRTFDLDDMGTGIGQTRRAERRGDRLLDGNDGDPFKRQHGEFSRYLHRRRRQLGYSVMPGLVPGIHASPRMPCRVDGRDKPGQHGEEDST